MKRIALILSLLSCAFLSFAQFPNAAEASNPNTLFHYRGALIGDKSVMIPVIDTLNNAATVYRGALTVRPQDSLLYMSDGVNWHPFVSSTNGWIQDSIFVKFPLGVYINSAGHQVIYSRQNGLFDGGFVSWSGTGLIFDITSANYGINYFPYFSQTMQVTLAAAPVTQKRTDLFILDTFALAGKITGDSSNNPVVPQFNPSSQLGLTSVTLNAGDTVPNIGLNVIYNEGIEWDTATAGTITARFNNTDNPERGTKAIFVSSYQSGGQLIFTDNQQDTLKAGDLFKAYVYLNQSFVGNAFQMQYFNGANAVSNKLALYSGFGFNPLDTGEYQIVVIPLNRFTFTSNYYDRVKITMQGIDTSGAGGFYLDYLQIQSGIFNPNTDLSNKVDSVVMRNRLGVYSGDPAKDTTEFYAIKGQIFFVHNVGSGGGGGSETWQQTLDNGSVLDKDNTVDGAQFDLSFAHNNSVNLSVGDDVDYNNGEAEITIDTTDITAYVQATGGVNYGAVRIDPSASYIGNFSTGGLSGLYSLVQTQSNSASIRSQTSPSVGTNFLMTPSTVFMSVVGGAVGIGTHFDMNNMGFQQMRYDTNSINRNTLIFPLPNIPAGTYYNPVSVNGNYADNTGNVTISTGGGSGITEAIGDNGLSNLNDSTIVLGGTLDNNTTINTSSYKLTTTGATPVLSGSPIFHVITTGSGSGTAILGENTDGTAITAYSTNGYAMEASSSAGIGLSTTTSSGLALRTSAVSGTNAFFDNLNTSTNTVIPMLIFSRQVSGGNGADGVGSSIQFNAETSTGAFQFANELKSLWSTANNATRTSQFTITGVNSGTTADKFIVKGSGVINIPTALGDYANNAAAITGGLAAGDIYRNGDVLMIVH